MFPCLAPDLIPSCFEDVHDFRFGEVTETDSPTPAIDIFSADVGMTTSDLVGVEV